MGFFDRILMPKINKPGYDTFELEDWRHWLGGILALAFVVLYPLAGLASLPYFLEHRHYYLIAINAALWLLFILRVLLPRTKVIFSRHVWTAAVYFMAISFFVALGPNYARSAWLIFCAVLATLFYGIWGAFWASGFNGLLLLGFYGLMNPAAPAWLETYRLGFSNWLMFIVSIPLLSLAASLPVGFMLSRLDRALKREKAANEQSARERGQLDLANRELTEQARERALAEQALKESEERLRLLADNLPDAMIYQVVAEADGGRRFTYVSKSVERLNELTVEAVLKDATALYGQVAPESLPELIEKEARSLQERNTFRHTIKSILPSGKVRWFDLASTPRPTPDGLVIWDGVQVDVTEREQAKEALRESENLYRTLVENSHDGILLVDRDFHLTYVNDELCILMGYPPEELLGRDFRQFLAEETAHLTIERYQARLRGEEPPSVYEFMIKRKDGVKRWVEVKAADFIDTKGEWYVVGQLLDITERRQAEEALKESENLYRALVEYSHAGVALMDHEHRYLYVNDEYCKMMGYSQEEILGQDFRTFLAEETAGLVEKNYLARQRGEDVPPRYEYMIKRKDGTKRWVEVSASIISGAKGQVRTVAQLLDITERKRAEEALKESEKLYRALVENSHAGIVLVGEGFRFSYVNDEFCQLIGYSREELLGQDFRKFLAEETAQLPVERYQSRLKGENPPARYEIMVKRKDGEKRWVEVSASLITDPQGRDQALAQLLDVTERKKAEEAIKQSERLYRAVVENSHDGIALFNENLQFEYVNEELCKISGYSQEEMLGHLGTEFLAEESIEMVRRNFAARQRGEYAPPRYELVGVRKDGEKRWLELSSSVIETPGGGKRVLAQYLDITERKRAEEALKESENLYRALAEHSHAGIVLIDDTFRFTYVNDEFCRIMGYVREELLGRDFRRYLAEETAHLPVEHYLARQSGESPPSHYEFMIKRKDGIKRWLETSSSVITTVEGEKRTLAQFLDVTERREAVEALRQSEQRFRASFNSAFQFTGLLTTTGLLLEANQTALDFIGMKLEDVAGTPFWKAPWWRGNPKQEKRIKDAIRRAAAGEFIRFEAENIGIGDRRIVVDFSLKPVYGEDGEVVMLLPEGHDITNRKRAEEALKESEEKFRQVIQASPMGVHMYELKEPERLVFQGANPAADRMLGIEHHKLVGLEIDEAFPGLKDSDASRRYREVAKGGKPWTSEVLEYQDERVSGAYEVYAFQTAPGKLTVMFQDITERKKAEEEKTQLEFQLRQSQKMEAIGTLTGGIAHDFNNILGAILSTAEASLLKGNDFYSLSENMGNIRDMTIRGRELVHRLMAFSRQDDQAVRSAELMGVVNDALALIRATLPPNVDIHRDLASGIWVRADVVQIQQVIMNLCTNAAQAMEEGGGLMSVRLTREDLSEDQARLRHGLAAGSYALIEVSDTGHGIPTGIVERIFDPFFTTKPMGRGTGLGLSLVHGIVRSHGGAVDVKSREGKGTVVSVWLPLAREKTAAREAEPSSATPAQGSGEHILVVDDEDIIAHTLAQSLRALGYRVSAYTSSLEAAAVLEKAPKRFDLILTDHMMPGLTGRQLAELALELRPGLPVVLMTGMTGDRDKFTADGYVCKVLTKPLTIKEIGEAVRQVLSEGRMAAAKAGA
jgi:two-component system cell cycle sensor histidine kinase/response regulator CckA